MTVRVTVTDINDNAPRFSQAIYTTTVPEFLAVGGLALQVNFDLVFCNIGILFCMHAHR